jgi:DNA-binding transcriptional LysR family regulator
VEQTLRGGRSTPRGQLFVTAPVTFGRLHVLPVMGELLTRYEDMSARMMLLDRNVRIVEEGIDVAVRIGALADSALRTLSLGSVQQTVVASPAYLATYGTPKRPADLGAHRCIVGTGPRLGGTWPFRGGQKVAVDCAARLTVDVVDAALAAAEAGVGIANVLSYQSADAVAAGRLVCVLAEYAPPALPVSLVYDAGRSRMPAVRAFIDAMRQRAAENSWGEAGEVVAPPLS